MATDRVGTIPDMTGGIDHLRMAARAGVREAAIREAITGDDWRHAARVLVLARFFGDWVTLGHESWGAYIATFGITDDTAMMMTTVGLYWWNHANDDLDDTSLAAAYHRVRDWRHSNGAAA